MNNFIIDTLLPIAYSIVVIITVIGYMPQVIKLWKSKYKKDSHTSINSWIVWLNSSIIFLVYGFYYIDDWRFLILTSINLLFNIIVILLILLNRYYIYSYTKSTGRIKSYLTKYYL